MNLVDYMAALRRDSEALASAAEGNLDLPVPACPDWTVADLVWHTGEVHHFWCSIVEGRLQDRKQVRRASRPDDANLIGWFRRGAGRIAGVLAEGDPDVAVWTWANQKNIAFVQRRMPQETAVHRWDAESASGSQTPIDPALAVDGVDEFLDVFLPSEADLSEGAESVHLHSTDHPGEWIVRVSDGVLEVGRGHAKGDAAVRGPASDLLLLLWRRLEPSDLDVLGDAGALTRFLGRADLT